MGEKTLGQIAHEEGERVGRWMRSWASMGDAQRAEWEAVAEAVAKAERERIAVMADEQALTDFAAHLRARLGE